MFVCVCVFVFVCVLYKGDYIVREGEQGQDVFFVNSGKLEVIITKGGEEKVISYMRDGKFYFSL